jgi:flagellar biogenesis protein FliO
MIYKPEFAPQYSWISSVIILIILLMLLLFWVRKNKIRVQPTGSCRLIEKKYLSNKTVLYVIEYQTQRFLLADNQHALTLHACENKDKDDDASL